MLEKPQKSMNLLEYHWDAMSFILTPAALKNLLIHTNELSYEHYRRVKGSMMVRMFSLMWERFNCLTTTKTSQYIWENLLASEGYIPICVPKNSISNDRFGFRDDQGKWCEWRIPSLQVIRLYWDNIFSGIDCKLQNILKTICAQLIATLPGSHHTCQCCHWNIPESEMHSQTTCTYCYDYQKYPHLKLDLTNSGIPFIRYNNPTISKPRSETLLEKFRSLKISS
jgi:hypothetical protein